MLCTWHNVRNAECKTRMLICLALLKACCISYWVNTLSLSMGLKTSVVLLLVRLSRRARVSAAGPVLGQPHSERMIS